MLVVYRFWEPVIRINYRLHKDETGNKMAETRVPSVLWNVSQSLSKGEKETARTNIGVNSLILGAAQHKFLTAITEDSNGNLSASNAQPVVDDIDGLSQALIDASSEVKKGTGDAISSIDKTNDSSDGHKIYTINSVSAYTSNPAMNGTASAGSSTSYSKGDHVHPSDTAKENVSNKITSWGTPTDTQYPSAKLTKDSIDGHKHYVKFNSGSAIEIPVNTSSTATSLNHSHGAITTDGKITESAVSIASGDSLLIANSSNAIKKSSLTFGTDATKYLNNKGEWAQPFFYRFSYTTTSETYYSQLSIRESPSTNEGLYLDESRKGFLVPEMGSSWETGQVLSLQHSQTTSKPIKWGNPYLTAYNTVESSQYTPTLHAGLHLGDGFGWGLSTTIQTPYNGHTFPTDTALIMEGASITMGKIGIVNAPFPEATLSAYYNERKITNHHYKNMLNGGVRTGVDTFGTSYVSIIGPDDSNQTIICRIPPHHWGIVSLCIHGTLRYTETQEYHTATKTLQWGGNIVPESWSISYNNDADPYDTTVTRGSLHFNSYGSAWANTTVLLHNSSDEVKAFKMWCESMTVTDCTYTTTIYKQILLFKTPEEAGAYNTPDETLFPPTN